MIPTAKLGEKCFSENIELLGNLQDNHEKGNLYIGLRSMAITLELISHAICNIDKRLSSIESKLDDQT